MANQLSPLQKVNQQFGSKEKLVSKLVGALSADDGESKDQFKARLLSASNRKLLRLQARAEALKAAGGLDKLAAAVTELQTGGKADANLLAKNKTLSVGRLLDLQQSLTRRARRAAK